MEGGEGVFDVPSSFPEIAKASRIGSAKRSR